jgi:hypothetical protein
MLGNEMIFWKNRRSKPTPYLATKNSAIFWVSNFIGVMREIEIGAKPGRDPFRARPGDILPVTAKSLRMIEICREYSIPRSKISKRPHGKYPFYYISKW